MKQRTLIVMSAILAPAVAIPSIAAAKTSAPSGTAKDCEANYRDNAHGFNCWKSQVVPTNAAWRLRRAHTGTCY